MSRPLTLIIDQGTHATRAFAFDEHGRIRASAYAPVALNRLSAAKIEQDAAEIVSSMHQVVQNVLANETVRQQGVAQAGVATQRSSVVAWDRKTGDPLAPMLSWQDRPVPRLDRPGRLAASRAADGPRQRRSRL